MKMKRVVMALCVAAAGVATPLVTATAAQADQVGCANYVQSKGYAVGPKVRAACNNPAFTWLPVKTANPACLTGLVSIRVDQTVANNACLRA
ncbi:hypothetical protein [Streptomyces sp. NPDC050848]|uniref:hypothetical protein n=1 Tax=Streptomyces sp. NPDC050848 TaxID=3155791 RepID=UPI00340473C5